MAKMCQNAETRVPRPLMQRHAVTDPLDFAKMIVEFENQFPSLPRINGTVNQTRNATLVDPMEEFSRNGFFTEENSRRRVNQDESSSSVNQTNLQMSPKQLRTSNVPRTPATRRYPEDDILCPFCRNNGETQKVYRSHAIRDRIGKITCPVLRRYVCPICSASGDRAHTISYCPSQNKISAPTSVVSTIPVQPPYLMPSYVTSLATAAYPLLNYQNILRGYNTATNSSDYNNTTTVIHNNVVNDIPISSVTTGTSHQ